MGPFLHTMHMSKIHTTPVTSLSLLHQANSTTLISSTNSSLSQCHASHFIKKCFTSSRCPLSIQYTSNPPSSCMQCSIFPSASVCGSATPPPPLPPVLSACRHIEKGCTKLRLFFVLWQLQDVYIEAYILHCETALENFE